MNFKVILFDFNPDIVQEFSKKFSDLANVSYLTADCRKLINENHIDIIVSPANSLGFMDGGIDYYYSIMFKGISKTVQTQIKKYNIRQSEKYYHKMLPIGSAIVVPTGHPKCPEMISAPTMEVPSDIENCPENVYYATYASLMSIKDRKDITVAFPGMGTGCGGITPIVCAEQMRNAFDDFIAGTCKIDQDRILHNVPGEFVINDHAIEQ